MGLVNLPLLWVCCLPGASLQTGAGDSYLYQPAYCLDAVLRGPVELYHPQPGDIFLATDQARWARLGHWAAGGAGVHHSGIIFLCSNGQPALLEAGPFNSIQVEVMDPREHMLQHVQCGDQVWIRRRCIPLTPEQSAQLTMFAEAQEGKPFATIRLVGQLSPFRSRGPLRTWFLGKPKGDRRNYFCSELVMESCVAAGVLDAATTRPSATYPRDLFFGHSCNLYLNKHLHLEGQWYPPARWTECPMPVAAWPATVQSSFCGTCVSDKTPP
jgi:hypothetical protein